MKITSKDIILDTDERIRMQSEPVQLPLSNEDRELLQAMLDYVRNSQNDEIAEAEDLQPAVGIAAVQVGVLKQMIAVVIPYEDGVDEVALVNPKIISESVQNAYLDNGEGCLSVKGEHPVHVFRHARIKVRGYDLIQLRFRQKAILQSVFNMKSITYQVLFSTIILMPIIHGKVMMRQKSFKLLLF